MRRKKQTPVDPIRRKEDLREIMERTRDSPRNHLLFTLGIQSGLRTGDLLKLRVYDICHLRVGQQITIKEGKTGKRNTLMINRSIYEALTNFVSQVNPEDDHYLFKSRKGENQPIGIKTVYTLVQRYTKGIHGHIGAHSLRKTWGYHQRIYHNVSYEVICKRYNHDSPKITMVYLGIEDSEVLEILKNEIG
jgi:integrase